MAAPTDGFTRVPNTLIEHSDLDAHELLVYIVLLKYRNQKSGKCWPGLSAIADEARASRRTVIRTIEKLETRGVIEVARSREVEDKNRSNIYTVHLFNEEQQAWFADSAKGSRKPKRHLSAETRQRMADAARKRTSDSESLPGAVALAPSDSQSPPSDSQSPPLVTPSHPNKTKNNKTNEKAMRSDLTNRLSQVQFEAVEDKATDKQLLYIHDLYIHLTNYIPTAEQKERWAQLTGDEASQRINTMLKQIPRYDAYEGPEYGTPQYNALSETGRQWADSGMVPEAA